MKLSHAVCLISLAFTPLTWANEKVSAQDKAFIEKAAQGGMTEVELGKLASAQGASADVKSFGAMMVAEHGAANAELLEVAATDGVAVSDKLNKKHAAMVAEMSKLSGAAFDQPYVTGMIKDHKKTIAEFEMEAKDGQSANVRAFAEKTLPSLETHRKKIQEIAKSMPAA